MTNSFAPSHSNLNYVFESFRSGLRGTSWEGNLFLVGGAVRDRLLGLTNTTDIDLVTEGSLESLISDIEKFSHLDHAPVTYPRFGTARITVQGVPIEFVSARKESYESNSRKPNVLAGSFKEDAYRRDFTVNTLMEDLFTGEIVDWTGRGLDDLKERILRTPLDPDATFVDDPLRMLRAVRFKWQVGLEPVSGLQESVNRQSERLNTISSERITAELAKMLSRPTASSALRDLDEWGLLQKFLPEAMDMKGVDQGSFHHLDVWNHTLLVIDNIFRLNAVPDLELVLAGLFHDIGKPSTKTIEPDGRIRFFSHESVGATMTTKILKRLSFPNSVVDKVAHLVKNHMRLGSVDHFTRSAARRVVRDMADQVEDLLVLTEADASSLRPGVKVLNIEAIRKDLTQAVVEFPPEKQKSPLTGKEIIRALGAQPGPIVGLAKAYLSELVLEGSLGSDDRESALTALGDWAAKNAAAPRTN